MCLPFTPKKYLTKPLPGEVFFMRWSRVSLPPLHTKPILKPGEENGERARQYIWTLYVRIGFFVPSPFSKMRRVGKAYPLPVEKTKRQHAEPGGRPYKKPLPFWERSSYVGEFGASPAHAPVAAGAGHVRLCLVVFWG